MSKQGARKRKAIAVNVKGFSFSLFAWDAWSDRWPPLRLSGNGGELNVVKEASNQLLIYLH